MSSKSRFANLYRFLLPKHQLLAATFKSGSSPSTLSNHLLASNFHTRQPRYSEPYHTVDLASSKAPSHIRSKIIQITGLPSTTTHEDLYKFSTNSSEILKTDFQYNAGLKFSGTCFLSFATPDQAQTFYVNARKSTFGLKLYQINYAFKTLKNQFFDGEKMVRIPNKTAVVYGFPKTSRVEVITSRFSDFEFISATSSPVVEYKHYKGGYKDGMKKYFVFYFATEVEAHRFVRRYNQSEFVYDKEMEPETLSAWIIQ